jgi:hypothetical protein
LKKLITSIVLLGTALFAVPAGAACSTPAVKPPYTVKVNCNGAKVTVDGSYEVRISATGIEAYTKQIVVGKATVYATFRKQPTLVMAEVLKGDAVVARQQASCG